MEKKKMKLWKKILLVLLAIFILFSIYVIRNYIIISNLEKTSRQYSNKTNYIANVYSIQSNSVNILRSYNKDGKYLSLIVNKVNDMKDTRKLTVYKTDNEGIGVIESGDQKMAVLNKNVIGGVQVVTYGMFGPETGLNILQKLCLSIISRITSEECNNKETFFIEMPDNWKMWIDKENGTIVREINGGFVTERNYEFDIVEDEDIAKPDISDCKIQK